MIFNLIELPKCTGQEDLTIKFRSTALGYRRCVSQDHGTIPAGIYLLKVNNRNPRAKVGNMFKVNSKATKTTLMASFW